MGILVDTLLALDFRDYSLWLAMAAVFLHAIAWRYLVTWEYEKVRLTVSLGSRKQAGYVVSIFILLLGTLRFFLVTSAMESQPRWIYFHSNSILVVGQLTMLMGLWLLASSVRARGLLQCLVCVHFNIYADGFIGRAFPYTVLKEPVSIATMLHLVGLSLLKASQAGVVLGLLTLFSNCDFVHLLPGQFGCRQTF